VRPVDWWIVASYLAFALAVGVALRRRGAASLDEFFLSGRRLPWWLAGTSIVATTFAVDTPLVISGWVRDYGIWKNWLWWCYALTGLLTGFVFARWWRRGRVMTKAEFAELRYGDGGARWLRGFLGVLHAGFVDVIAMCWVLLAATKIVDVLLGVDKIVALAVACAVVLGYSLLAGLWGVVVTDLGQFVISMLGAIVLAVLAWRAVGGGEAVAHAVAGGALAAERVAFLPRPGPGGPLSAAFWTTPAAALAVYLGVSWFAVESADGAPLTVQRISATRDERQGVLAVVWFAVANNALRPWPWILVAVASLLVLPPLAVTSPVAGVVGVVSSDFVEVLPADGATLRLELAGDADWRPLPRVAGGETLEAGAVVARSDSERAYVVMLKRYLPPGLLGLVAASLIAAFMSTLDTQINVAASFFVNDVYRRFLRPGADDRHYVLVARLASVGVLAAAAAVAATAESIGALFTLFISFLGGVGPIYLLRWFWWRVTAWAEIAAMVASAATTLAITWLPVHWHLGPLSPGGALQHEGRLLIVVAVSLAAALLALAAGPRAEPARLVDFYRRLRPAGAWGPVRELAGAEAAGPGPAGSGWVTPLVGIVAGLGLIFGLVFGLGHWLLGRPAAAAGCAAVATLGLAGVVWSLRRLR
jgi:solute:Na+ symporter, SSS family